MDENKCASAGGAVMHKNGLHYTENAALIRETGLTAQLGFAVKA